MEKFIPYKKLSKKKKKEVDRQKRTQWAINPVTRKPANPKAYNRKKTHPDDFSGESFSVFM
ncbi:MAG: hypothetical protein IJM02_06135 [Clostridia bacterium]|nr:hypothetical protein [Clostridia bacterium]